MILSLSEFWDGLGVVEADFYLPDRRVMEADASGQITPIQVGQRTWRGTVSIRRHLHADARAIDAKLEALKESDALFYLVPSVAQTSGATGTLGSVASDRRLITLTGVTVGVGDYVGLSTGSIYSLHQVVRVFTGDNGATSTNITVVPPLPLSISAGDAATTLDPQIKARIAVGARGPSFAPAASNAFSFEFHQVLT